MMDIQEALSIFLYEDTRSLASKKEREDYLNRVSNCPTAAAKAVGRRVKARKVLEKFHKSLKGNDAQSTG
jgi:hypothetical protein